MIAPSPPASSAGTSCASHGSCLCLQYGLSLIGEQLDSLQWMLHRESLEELEAFDETEVAEVYLETLRLRVHADAKGPAPPR